MILTGDDKTGVGVHAGWALSFHADAGTSTIPDDPLAVVTSDSYDGQIEATLPGGLEGGVYTVTIEGLSDDDYTSIAQGATTNPPAVMKLYLFWYDTLSGIGAYAANVANLTGLVGGSSIAQYTNRLVAVLSVVSVSRRVGMRHYETVVTARERVFERLSARVPASSCVTSPKRVVEMAGERAGIPVEFHDGFDGQGQLENSDNSDLGTAMSTVERGSMYRREIEDVATAIERATGRLGRGVLLIRDGVLHVGVRTKQVDGGEPASLTPRTGLVEVVAAGASGTSTPDASPPRTRYTLVLKGRPDLKPGAVVRFDLPPTEQPRGGAAAIGAAIAGALLGPILPGLTDEIANPQLLYVDSVTHRLGRTSSFVTTVTGVAVTGAQGADALYDPPPEAGARAASTASGGTDTGVRAARAVFQGVREAVANLRLAEAGEVRANASTGSGSATEPPRHTATVWRGLADSDGHPNRLARLPVRRDHPDIRERVARVSPFAWGRAGLVVPRYPGTRVLLAHGQGASDDPVDVGALWESGTGPDAKPGDWWLILPVGVDAAQRSSLADDEPGTGYTGKSSQDLIDADGNRVIEVGELTIRVTRDKLSDAGTRAARAQPADSVTIEHVDAGSRIVMTADGTVRIIAKRIELNAGSDGTIAMQAKRLELNAGGQGDIAVTARQVNVSVTDAMDVRQQT
jgi:hypothetical protein